jgi:hypothetical protein
MKKQKSRFKNWAKWSFIFALVTATIVHTTFDFNLFWFAFLFFGFYLDALLAYGPYYMVFVKSYDLNETNPDLVTPKNRWSEWAWATGIGVTVVLAIQLVIDKPMPWDSYPFTWSRMSQDPQSTDYQVIKAVVTSERISIGRIWYNDGRCKAYVHDRDGNNLIKKQHYDTDRLLKDEVFYFELNDIKRCPQETPKNFTFDPYVRSFKVKKFTASLDSVTMVK